MRWNLKTPFGLSPSKPRAALRRAQRERFQIIRKMCIRLAATAWWIST